MKEKKNDLGKSSGIEHACHIIGPLKAPGLNGCRHKGDPHWAE